MSRKSPSLPALGSKAANDYNDAAVGISYDRDVYSRYFARLLNQALKQGGGDARAALLWLEKRYRLVLGLFFSRHRREMSDAYMDVREHIQNRIKQEELGEKG